MIVKSEQLHISEGFSGLDGIDLLKKNKSEGSSEFELAFVDMNMPLMDGF